MDADFRDEGGKVGQATVPPEILQEVFKNLDLESLKACRQVCRDWNSLIYKENYFLSKVCVVHRAIKSKTDDSFHGKCSSNLNVSCLRIQQLYCSKYEDNPALEKLFIWLNSQNLKSFKHLEFRECQLLLTHFFFILNHFNSITHMTINDDTLIWNPYRIDGDDHQQGTPSWILRHGEKLLERVTKLHLTLKGLNDLLFTLNEANLLNSFQSLTELHLKGCLGSAGALSSGSLVTQLIMQNHRTLKSLRIDAFPSQYSELLNQYLRSYDSTSRNELCLEFQSFCQLLFRYPELFEMELPNLEELTLDRFPVANMNDIFVDEMFLPFLMKLKKLRKFSIGQLYFSNEEQYSKLVSVFPKTCQVKLVSVHLYVPVKDLDDINNILHPNQTILEYENASVEMGFDNVQWTICYLTWNSLQNTPLLQNHLGSLMKLKLHNVSVSLGDEEMQFILREGQQLVELEFDLCNLEELSDSGLTGLCESACDKIRMESYQVDRTKDVIGVSLSRLSKLKSLRLSKVGACITDASAKVGFENMTNLQYFSLCQFPQMLTHEGISHIVNKKRIHFEYYNIES